MFAKSSSAHAALMRFAAICAVTLSAGAIKTANAATITETVNFTASGFGPVAPVDPVMGSFTVTLDPTVNTLAATTGVTLVNINLPPSLLPPPLGYSFFPSIAGGQLDIAWDATLPNGDFLPELVVNNFASTPAFEAFQYEGGAAQHFLVFSTLTGSVSVVSPATPLPAALPLFATGLGALGLLGWRSKRKARASLLGAA